MAKKSSAKAVFVFPSTSLYVRLEQLGSADRLREYVTVKVKMRRLAPMEFYVSEKTPVGGYLPDQALQVLSSRQSNPSSVTFSCRIGYRMGRESALGAGEQSYNINYLANILRPAGLGHGQDLVSGPL